MIEALGSGSDFTPFLQHLGITSLSIQYGGESDQAGVYHSKYDSFDHYVRFGDPGFVYGIAEAETVGHVILRVADADVLPLQFAGFAQAVDGYVGELHQLTDQKRKAAQGSASCWIRTRSRSPPIRRVRYWLRSVTPRCRISISRRSTMWRRA